MQRSQKLEIQKKLNEFVANSPSQRKAADLLNGVSESIIIQIRKGNWDQISDQMWRNVGVQVGYSSKGDWQMVETKDFKTLMAFFDDAREYSNVFAIVADSGSGKTAGASHYKRNNANVYHIMCAEYFNRKVFLGALLEAMGKDSTGTVAEMMHTIIETLRKQESPLIILDEADKLPDMVLYFFITLYNMLHGKCGMVLLSTDYLSKRINRGLRLKKKGYPEIFSRIGRRFLQLSGTSAEEVAQICKVNGLEDPKAITHIYNEYDNDLRRVERAVHKSRKTLNKKAA
jgi:DNA transposition AAA+ family ATPase